MIKPANSQLATRNLQLFRGGFTLIELILVIIVISVLAAAAAERFLYYQERAEKAVMEGTLAAIKTGLQIRLAQLIMTNRQPAAAELERENPMRWLDEPPSNYAGNYGAPVKPGNWYFAPDARQLVYVPNNTRYLQGEHASIRELRFQVRLRYDEIDAAAGKARMLAGIALVPAQPYRWF